MNARGPMTRHRYARMSPREQRAYRRQQARFNPMAAPPRRVGRPWSETRRARHHLRYHGNTPWTSPSGVTYNVMNLAAAHPRDRHRIAHVLYHNRNDPARVGPHGFLTNPARPARNRPHSDPIGLANQMAVQSHAAPAPGGWHPGGGGPAVQVSALGAPNTIMHTHVGGGANRDRFDITPAPAVTTGYVGGTVGAAQVPPNQPTQRYRLITESPGGYGPGTPVHMVTFFNQQ